MASWKHPHEIVIREESVESVPFSDSYITNMRHAPVLVRYSLVNRIIHFSFSPTISVTRNTLLSFSIRMRYWKYLRGTLSVAQNDIQWLGAKAPSPRFIVKQ